MLNKLLRKIDPMPSASTEDNKLAQELVEFKFTAPELTQEEMSHPYADALLKIQENLTVLKEIAVAVSKNPRHRESVLSVCVDGAAMHTCVLHAIRNRTPQSKSLAIEHGSQEWISASDAYINRLVS